MELLLTVTLIAWLRGRSSQKTPWSYFLELLFFGGLVAFVSAIVEIRYLITPGSLQGLSQSKYQTLLPFYEFFNNLSASIIEEIAKYTVGVFVVLYSTKVSRITDVITFMIIVGLGFALTEDVVYLLNPAINAPERLISFYLHSGTAAIMGYAMGQLRFKHKGYRNLMKSIFYAIFLHLAYNSCSLIENKQLGLWLSVAVIVYIGAQVVVIFRKAYFHDLAIEKYEGLKKVKLLHIK